MRGKTVKVKICGNKRVEEALRAISLGADAIGLLVGPEHASRDFISPLAAQSIARQLPPFCNIVLATPIIEVRELIRLVNFIGADTLQLHGESTNEDIVQLKKAMPQIKIIKSVHVTDESSIAAGKRYKGVADAILLDSINKKTKQIGGTGLVHDWNISKRIVEEYEMPVILAGGLNPENVAEAIKIVGPYGVDTNSGTKGKDGFKDYAKLELFIRRAKRRIS